MQLQAQPQDHFYRAWAQTGGEVSPNFINRIVTVAGSGGAYYSASSVLLTGGGYGMRLIKYASGGSATWLANFDLGAGGTTHVGGITLDLSGNVVVTGSAYNGSTNGHDLFVVKYNSSGTKLWHQTYNGAGTGTDAGASVICNASGDIFVAGLTSQTFWDLDALTLCYASNGTLVWDRAWDNASLFDAGATLSLLGTRVIVTGASQTGLSTWEYAVLRYEQSDGTFVSAAVTDQGGTNIERVSAAATDADGNIYLTGALGASGQGFNIKTIKLSPALDILWTASWNGAANHDDAGRGIAVDTAGNVFVAGYTTAADRNGILLKYSPSGSLLFATGDSDTGDGEFTGIALTTAQGAFVCGYTSGHGNRDFLALLYSNDGALRWSDTYNGYANGDDWAQQVTPDGEGNFLVSGISDTTTLSVMYAHHALLVPAGESVNAPFVENRGQLMDTDERPADEVRYYTRSNYPNVYVLDDRVSFAFAHIDTSASTQDTMVRVDLTFASHGFGGGATVAVGLERREDFHNYYLGHIPEGRERVPLENKVLHPNIYDNVDALYGLGEDGFFLRFICKPGSSPGHVRMQFVGNSGLTVDSSGVLRVETDLEDLLFAAPTAIFVDDEGEETEAGWSPQFVINLDGTVRFTVDSVSGGSTLIVRTGRERGYGDDECDYYWSTYIGEVGDEKVKGSDVDALGFMYFTGNTSSAMFPTTTGAFSEEMNGHRDAFAARFRQLDERVWITYYGGVVANFGIEDDALCIKWNTQNNHVYFVGRTSAPNFPLGQSTGYFNNQVISGFRSRGFIVKLNAISGERSWATFFGDSEKRFDAVTALHIRNNGNVVVGGYSQLVGSSQSAFPFFPNNTPSAIPHIQIQGALYIAEFDPSNAQVWATKLTNELDVAATPVLADITEDSGGRLYVTGNIPLDGENDFIPMGSGSMDFSGFHDVFLIEFSQAKEIVWSTYLGGTNFDYANSVVSSSLGIMVTGTTFSSDFPTVAVGDSGNPLLNDLNHDGTTDIFVCEFQNDDFGGKILHWSRFLGGEGEFAEGQPYISTHVEDKGESVGNATALLDHNVIAITGSVPNDFSPLVASGCPYYYGNFNRGVSQSGTDAILVIIKNRAVVFSTYWGGDTPNAISHDAGTSISKGIAPNGSPFVLLSGHTNSREFAGQGITIPVCRELPFPGSYYNDNFLGGTDDAFISKIYYGECLITGINTPNSPIQNLSIWPNPAGDVISILLPSSGGLATSIRLFDAAGKAVSSVFPTESSFSVSPVTVEIASLPPGFYFVVVQSSGRTYNGRFVKM